MPPLAPNECRDLALGILNLLSAEGGFATKTKLLKLLYLADIEAYRDARTTLTGFDWIFHLYGPWTPQYDQLLHEMESEGLIEIRAGGRPDLDAQFIHALAKGNFDKLSIPVTTWLGVKHMAKLWANESTGEMLNYVYFQTEPMVDARRGAPIDFSRVAPRAESPLYARARSSVSRKELHAAQAKLRESRLRRTNPRIVFTPPAYDETFSRAIDAFDESD